MKNSLKKILLLVAVIITAMVCLTFSASAAKEDYYTYEVKNGAATITDVDTSISGDVSIPSTLGGYPVTSIGDYAFSGCKSLTSITIPDSVTSIGDRAFYVCTSLTSITVDENNQYFSSDEYGILFNKDKTTLIQYPIGNGRSSYIIPDSVTSIGDYAFFICTSLTSVTIPDSVIKIGDCSFLNCTSLTSITIGDSVTSIGSYAFRDCTSLTSVTIPDSVTSIGDSAFYGCSGIESIIIGDGVTDISNISFSYLQNLKSVVIGDGVSSIGESFYNCPKLENITLGDGIRRIGEGAFADTAYYNNEDNWSDGILYIGKYLIAAKPTITEAKIRPDTKLIADYSLACCLITSVVLPRSVEYVGTGAFLWCSDLETIVILNPDCEIEEDMDLFYEYVDFTVVITGPITISSRYADNIYSGEWKYYFDGKIIGYPGSTAEAYAKKHSITFEGHDLKEIGEKAPSCQTPGYMELGCCECDFYCAVKTEQALGHAYSSSYTVVEAATCTKEGSKSTHCTRSGCTAKTTKSISALGHAYSSSYTVDKKATCTKEGSKSKHCTRSGCTAKTSVKSISALGHSYGAYKTTKKATLTANGTKVKTCSRCSAKSTATIYKVKTIKLSTTSYIYNGKAKKPTVTVKNSKGNTLKNGTDYKVTYSANTAIGTAKATITFMGNYTGSKVLTFKIALGATDKIKATQGADYVKLSWNKVAGAKGYKVYVYDSKGELQLVKTTTKTSLTVDDLSKGTYYKFTVKAYTKIKKETVWAEKTKSVSVTTNPGTPTLKATAGKGKVSLSWTKQSGSNGYVVYMATSKKGEYSKIGTFEGVANLKATKKKLKSGKTYYFKVRAYKTVDGKNIYSSWSAVKSVKVK